MQQQAGEFSVEETITGRVVSNSNIDKCKVNDKVNKNHLLQNVHSLCCIGYYYYWILQTK